MGHCVGVRMAGEAFRVGNLDAAQNELAARGEGVGVVADADAHEAKITFKSRSFAPLRMHLTDVCQTVPQSDNPSRGGLITCRAWSLLRKLPGPGLESPAVTLQ